MVFERRGVRAVPELDRIKSLEIDQFEGLYHISQKLIEAEYRENLMQDALDIIIKALDAERGLFIQFTTNSQEFVVLTGRNFNKETIDDSAEFSSSILRQVKTTKEPCLVHDVLSDPKISQFESIQAFGIKSVIAVPVLHNGEVWGAIVVDSIMHRKEFTEQNLKFMRFFSNLLSLALDRLLREESLHKENIFLKNQLINSTTIPDIIGESPAMKSTAALIHKVAATEASVLLLGESGTGKDIIASSIHKLSARKDSPFLAQFCGSIADSLLESELFGYKKGAFTGAVADKKGLFEAANKGTFFLDEIGDISMPIQAKLLRVLQNKELIRVGDNEPLKVDVRIIAATNKDLRQLTKENKFREDLFYRLNVFPITIPPLRERTGDVKLLANYFIRKHSNKDLGITREALNLLENYLWPGNVRQLENTIQRALILCDDNMIQTSHIILEQEDELTNFSGTLQEFEKLLLFKRLQRHNGNRTATAKSLDVSVRWIQLKLKEAASEDHSDLKNI